MIDRAELTPLEERLLARYLSREELAGIRELLVGEGLYCPEQGVSPFGYLYRHACTETDRHFFSFCKRDLNLPLWRSFFTVAMLDPGGSWRTITGRLEDAGQTLLLALGAPDVLDAVRERTRQFCLQLPQ